jgi:branched-chain amino acid transport system substrate-binding protein
MLKTGAFTRRSRNRWFGLASLSALVVLAGCSNASNNPSTSNTSTAPGVTANRVNVGALATLSSGIAADFAPIVPGVQAYFDMVNAHGGVDGRRLVLSHVLDDGGNPTADLDTARTLVQQDHVFAIVGVATAFFGAAPFLVQSGTPTFGYATEDNWSPAPNLFAAYGSVVSFSSTTPEFVFVAKKLHATSAALIAYNVPQSSDECQGAMKALASHGVHVGYSDLAVPYGSDLSSDVVHMKQAGVDFVVSCMDVPGNIDLSRLMQQNGLTGVKQLWLDGYDESTLRQYSSLMQGTYFLVEHVPFQAAQQFPRAFPGLSAYIAQMNKYEPKYTLNEVAMDGWLSAALFVAGLRAVGPDLTQQKLTRAINHLTAFTGNGLETPVNWATAHTTVTSPSCEAYVTVRGDAFHVAFNRGRDVWVCFPLHGAFNVNRPVAPPQGAPGT